MQKIILAFWVFTLYTAAYAQQDSIQEEQIDYSQFSDMGTPEGSKRYCTSKVLGLSPNKLITVAYDFQGAHELVNTDYTDPNNMINADPNAFNKANNSMNIQSSGGLRLAVNIPVLSNTKWLINLGGTYWRNGYRSSFTNNTIPANYVLQNLTDRGLTTIGLNATIFKPLNERHFLLAFTSADANGDYNLNDSYLGDYLLKPKITAVGFFGWKRNDRSMLAVGLSHTYRPGAKGLIPLILFNHTFENRKWGIEALFPARLAFRRSFNPRNLLMLGYELEGNSYSMINRTSGTNFNSAYNNLELRRSEIRPRISYEKAITDFIWVTAQIGYRINYNFNIDQGDIFRIIGSDKPYYMENTLSNTLYFQVGINLVSP